MNEAEKYMYDEFTVNEVLKRPGLYEQYQQVKLEDYNNLTMEDLETFTTKIVKEYEK